MHATRPLLYAAAAFLLGGLISGVRPAQAANWVAIQGAERATEPTVRWPGFVQAGYAHTFARPVRGLSSLPAFNGRHAVFNLTGSGNSNSSFFVRRARIGARGLAVTAPTEIGFAFQAEFGDNDLTRADPVVLTDAVVHARIFPGARVKAGQFKMPIAEEALEGNPYSSDFIAYSAGTAQLLVENPIVYDPATRRNAYAGGGNGFRDIGVQVYDWVRVSRWEWTYAAMLSNGRFGGLDDNSEKDGTARLSAAYVFSGSPLDLRGESISAFVWHGQGRRTYREHLHTRIRRGGGVEYDRGPVRLRSEYIYARGMVETGLLPAFGGGQPAVSIDGTAHAWYVQSSYRLLRQWEANLRYDQLDRLPDDRTLRRIFHTVTIGAQWQPQGFRLLFNYEIRRLDAPGARGDAQVITDAMADRASVQGILLF